MILGWAAVVSVPARLAPVTVPVTFKLPRVPTEVILGWAAVVSVPARLAPVTVPVTFKLERVPTLVTLGWAAVVSVPPILEGPYVISPDVASYWSNEVAVVLLRTGFT